MLSVTKSMVIIEELQKKPHVDAMQIAVALGAHVYEVKDWPSDLSVSIMPDQEKGGYGIYINDSYSENKQRWSIAHALGHLVLHDNKIDDGIQDDDFYCSHLNSALERQANEFAVAVLMPWHLVNAEISKGITCIPELAEIFRVSSSAMSIRLSVPFEE